MALLTFLSDFGLKDHYVAAVKAKILSVNQMAQIIDISHHIHLQDLAQAAQVLGAVFRDFPPGSIHLVGVEGGGALFDGYVAAELEGHYILTADNGIFGLLSDLPPSRAVQLPIKGEVSSFAARQILAPAAAQLSLGQALEKLGEVTEVKRLLPRQNKMNKGQIIGAVARVDHYGNLITTIEKKDFTRLCAGRKFQVIIGRERQSSLVEHYLMVDPGDCFMLFNSSGLLEIGINQGSAQQLLGLSVDSPVRIEFFD